MPIFQRQYTKRINNPQSKKTPPLINKGGVFGIGS